MDTTIKSDHSITSLKNQHGELEFFKIISRSLYVFEFFSCLGNYPKWVSKRKIQQMKKVKQKKKITKKQAQKKSKV